VWQSLFGEMKDHGFTVLAVAMDQLETAQPWIEAAMATYPCLIDRDHHLADLYNMVNVPQAVWIDEEGRIARPPETAGSMDAFRAMDRKTFTIPEEVMAERDRVKAQYFDAVRDWVLHGAGSVYAMNATRAAEKLKLPDATMAEAHARFHLGRYLLREGQEAEAQVQMAEASRLHPDSWAMWRQAAAKDTRGLASGPEFWKRVDALGSRHYYPPAEIDDMT
jgi:hypothetical protein